jgi:hypothetical protein
VSASKQKGTAAESACRDYCRSRFWPFARRLVLAGSKDEGDLSLGDGINVTIEVKNVAAMALASWVDEARTEAETNGHRIWFVWHKRRGKGSPADWYCTTDGRTMTRLLADAGHRSAS